MLTDIQIATKTQLKPISSVAEEIGLKKDYLKEYGPYIAKITKQDQQKKKGKLILVSAMTPTKHGEGKTTMSIALAQGLKMIGKKAILALREPSLGPTFGMKGGACGGGYSQLAPMEDINLHFTGDFHAISTAHNLLAATLDNHIYHGNKLHVNPEKISWRRVIDLCDRQLRDCRVGKLGGKKLVARESGFDIVAASEIMAALCLSNDRDEFTQRLSKLVVGQNNYGEYLFAEQFNITGAMKILLKDALLPNLVQTLEGVPALVHMGPFANVAHGCNSIQATKLAIDYGDYAITEAGFGTDLGAEKFINIKCRHAKLKPSLVVIVATVRAIKHQGQKWEGLRNLGQHIENIFKFNLKCVVAINAFPEDTNHDHDAIVSYCKTFDVKAVVCHGFSKGGEGSKDLAEVVVSESSQKNEPIKFTYDLKDSLDKKINAVAKKIYRCKNVEYSDQARNTLIRIEESFSNLGVCVAKTQYSFSDDPKKINAPINHTLHVEEIRPAIGAGFIVVRCGKLMLMPGMPLSPAAEKMSINNNNEILGLF
ncbi:MAG TPA: formate--tetrahydrofolate ligase [Gammaproteobacteria bacterium]|nr:formate--tetrahydrofolate ligase [Gammaproteobacteria bacterium]